jgi:hypothetical protein
MAHFYEVKSGVLRKDENILWRLYQRQAVSDLGFSKVQILIFPQFKFFSNYVNAFE